MIAEHRGARAECRGRSAVSRQKCCASRGLAFLDLLERFREIGAERLHSAWDPRLSEQGQRVYAAFLLQRTLPAQRGAY